MIKEKLSMEHNTKDKTKVDNTCNKPIITAVFPYSFIDFILRFSPTIKSKRVTPISENASSTVAFFKTLRTYGPTITPVKI